MPIVSTNRFVLLTLVTIVFVYTWSPQPMSTSHHPAKPPLTIPKFLQLRRSEFTTTRPFTLTLTTWNVNGRFPDDVSHLLTPSSDLQFIGLQEIDVSPPSLLLPLDPAKQIKWAGIFQKQVGRGYQLVATKQLVGLLLLFFAHRKLVPYISVLSHSTGTGILGILGNKGAVAMSVRIYDSTICVVNAHLAADEKLVERRNQEYIEIGKRLEFGEEARRIGEHDILLWMGDLNYRVLAKEHIAKQMINNGEITELFAFDQFTQEKNATRIFQGFVEGKVDFAPTYKFDVGTNRYDTSEKRRVPSWCDRILYREGDAVKQTTYQSHPELLDSDHKPVSSIFQLQIDDIDKEKYAVIHAAAIRELDKSENDAMPDGHLTNLTISLGQMTYLETVAKISTLENRGSVVLHWKIIPKLEDTTLCKLWLSIQPTSGMLVPGEKIDIRFSAVIDKHSVVALNTGKDSLDDIIVLHIINGKDYFITVDSEWLPSCYGIALEALVQMKDSVRGIATSPQTTNSTNTPLSVPREIWRMLDFLFVHGLSTPGLFLVSGQSEILSKVRHALSTGTDFDFDPAAGVHSMAEAFVEFLDALPEPVIPYFATEKCIEASPMLSLSKAAVQALPSIHYNVFVYIMSFLREVLNASKSDEDIDQLNADRLAIIFSAVLIRNKTQTTFSVEKIAQRDHQKVEFIKHFLIPRNT